MERLRQLAINPQGFVFDPACGESFTVNTTGLFILNGLQVEKSSQAIIQELAVQYHVAQKTAERDVLDFISHLRTYGLL